MRTRLAIASSVALALFGCGSSDQRVSDTEPGDYESSDPAALEEEPFVADTPQPAPDVAAAPSDAAPTAPAGSDADLEITRKIREKLVAGSEPLSSQAQSIEVDAQQGVVTLRGPVESEQEKETVLSIARSTDGVTRVDDRLEIAKR